MKCRYCNYENKEGDNYCENCGASLEIASGAMDDISAIPVPTADTQTDASQTSSAQPDNYSQPNGYGQPSGYSQSNNYGQSSNYGQPNNYGQPSGTSSPSR